MKEKDDDGQLALMFLYRRPDETKINSCEKVGKKMLETAQYLKENVPGGKQRDKVLKALMRVGEFARAAILE